MTIAVFWRTCCSTNFYGGVIELTGSDAFKQKAMRLIIEHNINVRMKHADQRLELDTLRKEMAVGKDAVVTHQPTPELNRNTPEQPVVPDPVQEKATQSPASPVAPEASTVSTVPASSPAEPAKRQMRHKVKNHQKTSPGRERDCRTAQFWSC